MDLTDISVLVDLRVSVKERKHTVRTPYKTMGIHSRTDNVLTRAIPVLERSMRVNTSQVTATHVAINFTLA